MPGDPTFDQFYSTAKPMSFIGDVTVRDAMSRDGLVALLERVGPSIVLRSMEAPRLVFGAVTVSSVIAVAAGIPLTRAFGVTGAAWSIVLSETLAFVAAVVLVRRKAKESAPEPTACLAMSASESQ